MIPLCYVYEARQRNSRMVNMTAVSDKPEMREQIMTFAAPATQKTIFWSGCGFDWMDDC